MMGVPGQDGRGQDCQHILDIQNGTGRIELAEQDRQINTVMVGLPERDNQDRTARTGLPGHLF
jgi:hypothetical protein